MKPEYKSYNKIYDEDTKNVNDVPVVEDLAPSKEEKKEVENNEVSNEEPKKEEIKIGKIIKCSAVNLRSEPSLNSLVKTTVRVGEHVKVVNKIKNFYFVKFNSYEGYIMDDYVDVEG